jgi:hypothetical protein
MQPVTTDNLIPQDPIKPPHATESSFSDLPQLCLLAPEESLDSEPKMRDPPIQAEPETLKRSHEEIEIAAPHAPDAESVTVSDEAPPPVIPKRAAISLRRRHPQKQAQSLSQRRHSSTRQKAFVCYRCGASFSAVCLLARHSLTHTHKKDTRSTAGGGYPCSINNCTRSFPDKASLLSHQKHHRPRLACPQEGCGKRFRSTESLNVHVKASHREKRVR